MKEQDGIDIPSKYAARLGEERKRRFPHQGDFARQIGITQGRQSLYERGERDLRVDYLGVLAEAGLDVAYIITGRRSAELLDEASSEIVTAIRALEPAQQQLLLAFLTSLQPGRATIHDRGTAFDAGPPAIRP